MMSNKIIPISFLAALFCFFTTVSSDAQGLGEYTEQQVKSYKAKAEDQVRFLGFLLNTLGNEKSSNRDKDVIIRESYKKIFKDAKVQVEDDLTENRKVLINKDITAYLKDIDFFFRQVKFDFEIKEVEPFLRENGELSFKVTLNRTLKGVGIEGESILNSKKRFIEINLNPETEELQIASIYTTKVSRDEALKEWWNSLSFGWKTIFKEKLNLSNDSVSLSELNRIASLDSIDLSGNSFIVGVEPLTMLVDLKSINLSNTKIQDISPLSSLTDITKLNISNTAISDISFLRYAEKMRTLDISFTQVKSIDDLLNLKQLRSLSLKGTNITQFKVLENFSSLEKLNLSESFFDQLIVLTKLNQIKELNLSRTNIKSVSDSLSPNTLHTLDLNFTAVSNLAPLSGYKALKSLNISNTQVLSLTPLQPLSTLEKIYADNTFITLEKANEFTDKNPGVLIIINSEELSAWYATLSQEWKSALKKYMPYSSNGIPAKETLTKLLLSDSLNLSNSNLEELFALKKFSRLRYLNISENRINSLDPLSSLNGLIHLNASETQVASTDPILSLKKLNVLNLSQTRVGSDQLLKLSRLKSLKLLNVDQNEIEKSTVRKFLTQINNDVVVIYDQTGHITWWNSLATEWQQIFRLQMSIENPPSAQQLHEVTSMKKVVIIDEGIYHLKPLVQFIQLESLYLERVNLTDLEDVTMLEDLKSLTIKESSISNIDPLSALSQLETLNLDFSAVDDLRSLQELEQLSKLSVAGTSIKNLKGLEELYNLRYLNISSTLVRNLKWLSDLDNLEELTCFNTRIWNSRIRKFKKNHPDCIVRFY